MGVPGLFGALKTRYPVAFKTYSTGTPVKCDSLYIDTNPIIHSVASTLSHSTATADELDCLVVQGVIDSLEELITLYSPTHTYISVDGVAPFAKQLQQRARRWVHKSTGSFDTRCISAGTEFMDRLDQSLSQWSRNSLAVQYSGHREPGEGEHKIMDMLRHEVDTGSVSIVYGPDADLILLAMTLPHSRLVVARESFQQGNIDYVMISSLKKLLLQDILPAIEPKPQCTIDKFVTVASLLGNDFVPRLEMMPTVQSGLTMLLKLDYSREPWLQYTLSELHGRECAKLCKNAIRNSRLEQDDKFRCTVYGSCWDGQQLSDRYDDAYYHRAGVVDVAEMCRLFLQGIEWVRVYYTCGIARSGWEYKYPFQYAPLLQDLVQQDFTESPTSLLALHDSTPVDPTLQLLLILPRSAIQLLPEQYRHIMETEEYDCTATVCHQGKRQEWEGVVMLAPPDVDKISSMYREIKYQQSIEKAQILTELAQD